MGNKIGKLADREATEGTVQSYIHANGKVGVLVEVDCNTDFVAKNDDFIEFAKEVALHIAASPTAAVRLRGRGDRRGARGRGARLRAAGRRQAREHPAEDRRGPREEVARGGRAPQPDARQRGQARVASTIEQMRADLSAKTGENVVIRRFARFAVGE